MNGLGDWLWLAAGGAAGMVLRYALGGWMARSTGGTFPWETCAINISGSLAIGVLAGYADRGGFPDQFVGRRSQRITAAAAR